MCAAELSVLPTATLVHLLYEPWRMRGGIGEFARPLVDETRAKLGLTKLSDDLVEIREAIDDVLGNETYRAAAQRMAGVIAGYGNGERAVAELEGLL